MGREWEGGEGTGRDVTEGREGRGMTEMGLEGKGWEGKGMEGEEREGKGREVEEREGRGRQENGGSEGTRTDGKDGWEG